jgi:S-DNA-T family DNA segregation ATPase FtsK/SpoIIIE
LQEVLMIAAPQTQMLLEYQANQIETVLASHRVATQIIGGTVTPRWVRFQAVPGMSTKIARIAALSEEIALQLGAPSVRVARQDGAVQIEVPRSDFKTVRLLPLLEQSNQIPRQTAMLGIDESGLPLLLRLSSPEVAHVLIAGTTGSGKTALARSIALSLAMNNRLGEIQMLFIDPKRSGFGVLAQTGALPHLLRPVVDDVHQAVFLLGEMVSEMVRRDRERITEPRLVIFIDEVADLMEQGGKAMDRLLTRLTQRGRSAGIHLIACTQKPLAAVIGSLTRSNFPVRLVGSVASADDARTATGMSGTGAEKLLGRGDFLLVAKGNVTRFQAAYASGNEIRRIINYLQTQHRQRRSWLEEAPDYQSVPATGTEGSAAYSTQRRPIRELLGRQLRLIK